MTEQLAAGNDKMHGQRLSLKDASTRRVIGNDTRVFGPQFFNIQCTA